MKKFALLATVALSAMAPGAHASLITTASLFTVQAAPGSLTTPIVLAGITPTASQAPINGSGYTVTFNVPAGLNGQGVVRGAQAGRYAIPVAGISGNSPTFLTGDFNSGQTTDPALSGNYLSTGGTGSSIVITFSAPQTSFALLWGSIDGGNEIAFNNQAGDTLTGADIQFIAQGFVSNGFQGPGGSAYVATTSDTTFTTVTLTSDNVSFEAAAFAASNQAFVVPEPMSIALIGAGLVGLGLVRRNRQA